jgi:hypothetical protein
LEGQSKTPKAKYPDEEYLYYICAKEFGWTVLETDEQPAAVLDWLISIHNIVRQVENDNNESEYSN